MKSLCSIPCPGCYPEDLRKEMGKRAKSYWTATRNDQDQPVYQCNNCYYQRPRQIRKTGTGITQSQRRAADRIRRYFEKQNLTDDPLYKYEEATTEYGKLWVRVSTRESPYTTDGGSFSIGRRGKIEVWQVYGLKANPKRTAKHYAFMLGGHVSKYC